MATEVGKAYVQIVPKTEGFKSKLTTALGGDAASAGKSAGESCGSNFGENLVKNITRIIAAAGIGKVLKEALDAGGALQQSFGGIDTLYTNTTKTLAEFREESGLTGQRLTEAYTAFQTQATDAMKSYAREAANMGISMNDYAEQAVSFGAALKSAYGGDVVEAAKAADVAIRDMADNSAKMGTDIGAVQSAYQGFAKQNYTMLDNLKLGRQTHTIAEYKPCENGETLMVA